MAKALTLATFEYSLGAATSTVFTNYLSLYDNVKNSEGCPIWGCDPIELTTPDPTGVCATAAACGVSID